MSWFLIQKGLPGKKRLMLIITSFLLPLAVWSAISYIPFIWHPLMRVVDAGDSLYVEEGQRISISVFEQENTRLKESGEVLLPGLEQTLFIFLRLTRC